MNKFTKKLSGGMEKLVASSLLVQLGKAVEQLKEIIMSEYDANLSSAVTDRNSKTNPKLYRDDFVDRLNKFVYLENINNQFVIRTPDMENFNFSGRLGVIETIMNGLIGIYVEVTEEDYENIYGKRPINQDPVDEYVPIKERIYLIKYDSRIRKAERDLNKKFVRYPFSNSPPIDIFSAGDKFVNDNLDKWIDSAIDIAEKEFARIYGGAKL